jgi:cyclopropane fatty-acyl-phospholipid synthase-like methyltransferase
VLRRLNGSRFPVALVDKPFAESCIENSEAIFSVLAPRLAGCTELFEIGSGTGQHAVYLAPRMPQLVWHTSDRRENHPGILAWLEEAGAVNIRPPVALDVLSDPWPERRFDAVFSANTAHIMPRQCVAAMLRGVAGILAPGGLFLLYGPFNYHNRFTSQSNARFDAWLKARDPAMGIRDLAWLTGHAEPAGLSLVEDIEMPANNRTLVWRRGD